MDWWFFSLIPSISASFVGRYHYCLALLHSGIPSHFSAFLTVVFPFLPVINALLTLMVPYASDLVLWNRLVVGVTLSCMSDRSSFLKAPFRIQMHLFYIGGHSAQTFVKKTSAGKVQISFRSKEMEESSATARCTTLPKGKLENYTTVLTWHLGLRSPGSSFLQPRWRGGKNLMIYCN